MLIRKLLFRKDITRLTCLTKKSTYSSQTAVQPETTGTSYDFRLPEVKLKKPKRDPFVQNFYLGKFDVEFIIYPEPQTHERHGEFFKWLKPIEDYMEKCVDAAEIDATGRIKNEIFEELRKLGVFRAQIDTIYGGLGLNDSEQMKLVETVSSVPVLGTYLIKRATIIKLLTKYGSDEQKSYLLPKIANSELTPTLCFTECPTGSTSVPLTSKVVLSECSTYYTLKAYKTWVFDANEANLFIVTAPKCTSDVYVKYEGEIKIFLIPGNTPGIKIEKSSSVIGQKGVRLCEVNFTDVKIPVEQQLGKSSSEADLYISLQSEGKNLVGAQAIGLTKHFLNLLTKSVIKSKNFNTQRHLEDSTHLIIGKVSMILYAMEAMVYMTAGMTDNYQDQDSTLEKLLVECFCAENCIKSVLEGLSLLGVKAFDEKEPFERIIRDSLTLHMYDRAAMDTKIFASLLGLKYVGPELSGGVKHHRNPLMYPVQVLRGMLKFSERKRLHIDDNLHPTLILAATSLEQSVKALSKCTEMLLTREGVEIVTKRMELQRLTDILISIYAMTAVISRSSRSYCIGLRNSEEEIKVALYFSYQTYQTVHRLVNELVNGDWANGDILLKEVANTIFDKKEYFATHPLQRNF